MKLSGTYDLISVVIQTTIWIQDVLAGLFMIALKGHILGLNLGLGGDMCTLSDLV